MLAVFPESVGVYRDLFKFIFNRETLTDNIYNESDIRYLISLINKIYLHKKQDLGNSSVGIVVAIIQDYINEVNSKYGLIKKLELDSLQEKIKKAISSFSVGPEYYSSTTNTGAVIESQNTAQNEPLSSTTEVQN